MRAIIKVVLLGIVAVFLTLGSIVGVLETGFSSAFVFLIPALLWLGVYHFYNEARKEKQVVKP